MASGLDLILIKKVNLNNPAWSGGRKGRGKVFPAKNKNFGVHETQLALTKY